MKKAFFLIAFLSMLSLASAAGYYYPQASSTNYYYYDTNPSQSHTVTQYYQYFFDSKYGPQVYGAQNIQPYSVVPLYYFHDAIVGQGTMGKFFTRAFYPYNYYPSLGNKKQFFQQNLFPAQYSVQINNPAVYYEKPSTAIAQKHFPIISAGFFGLAKPFFFGATEYTVIIRGNGFSHSVIYVNPGELVSVSAANASSYPQTFSIRETGATTGIIYPGQVGKLEFIAPKESGASLTYYSGTDWRKEFGFSGRIVVR